MALLGTAHMQLSWDSSAHCLHSPGRGFNTTTSNVLVSAWQLGFLFHSFLCCPVRGCLQGLPDFPLTSWWKPLWPHNTFSCLKSRIPGVMTRSGPCELYPRLTGTSPEAAFDCLAGLDGPGQAWTKHGPEPRGSALNRLCPTKSLNKLAFLHLWDCE
jgi:hypothetical protein